MLKAEANTNTRARGVGMPDLRKTGDTAVQTSAAGATVGLVVMGRFIQVEGAIVCFRDFQSSVNGDRLGVSKWSRENKLAFAVMGVAGSSLLPTWLTWAVAMLSPRHSSDPRQTASSANLLPDSTITLFKTPCSGPWPHLRMPSPVR